VLLVSSLLSGKAWQERAKQTEKNHSLTNSAVSRQVYVHALLVQHLYQHQKAEKLVKIHRLCRAEEDKHQILFKLFDLYFTFFEVFKFRCCSFCLIKKIIVNCTSVLLILFFTS